jgi:rhodanese-related sulfurtransferase
MTTPPNDLEITCNEVKSKLDAADNVVLLDCREQDEYELVKLEAGVLLPMSELMSRVGELDEHRGKELIVYCHFGGRSLQVASWLRNQGFDGAKSMAGGIDGWAVEIEPGMARY